MVGDLQFVFQATYFTHYTMTVNAGGARIETIASSDQTPRVYEKAWDVAFADVEAVTVYNWRRYEVEGEAVYLHCRNGKTVMFMTSPTWRAAERVSETDRANYFAAAAAVLKALTVAKAELRVRSGRPVGWKIKWAVILLLVAISLSSLFIWQTSDMADGAFSREFVVATIFVMVALFGVYRREMLAPARYETVGAVAEWMAKRAPRGGAVGRGA